MTEIYSNRISAIAAFKSRSFFKLWSTNLISNTGSWVHNVALGLWAHEKYGTPGALGLLNLFSYIPIVVFFLAAGIMADISDRRKLLIYSQLIMTLAALALAIEIAFDAANLVSVSITVFVMGTGLAFSFPAFQALIPSIVKKEHVLNAISLNSASYNMARLIGPMLAGVIIPLLSLSACFFINSLSFLPFIIALFFLKLPKEGRKEKTGRPSMGLVLEGVRFAVKEAWARRLFMTLGIMNLLLLPYLVFLPIFGKDILRGGNFAVALLFASSGFGAMAGVPVLNILSRSMSEYEIVKLGIVSTALSIIFFSFSERIAISMPSLFVTGMSFLLTASSINSMLQLNVSEHLRGRVMSIYVLLLAGVFPIGGAVLGWLSDFFGVTSVLSLSAIIVLMYGISLFYRKTDSCTLQISKLDGTSESVSLSKIKGEDD